MSIEIYSPDLRNRHEITHAISVQMSAFYNDIGKIILVLPIDDYNINAVKINSVVYDTIRDLSFIIQNLKYDTNSNRITANGYTCNWLLNKRTITNGGTVGNVESDVYSIVQNNLRGLSPVELAEAKGFTATAADVPISGGQLLDGIIPLLSAAGLGQKMAWDAENETHVFEIYSGSDLTDGIHAVIFSEEFGTARELVLTEDNSTFANVFFIRAGLLDDSELALEIGTAEGNDRYEMWIENSGVTQDEGESLEGVENRLTEAAALEAQKLIRRQTFAVTIDASEYGSAYSLGDIVSCVSNRFGVEFSSRITGVKYTLDANGEKTALVLGDPILTALGEVKLKNG